MTDTLSQPSGEFGEKALGQVTRVHAFPTSGVHRVALRVTGKNGRPSPVMTWGAEVVCGTAVILGVDVEGSGRMEPVTAALHARAEPGCEPILRYHWDFDGNGQFDEVTAGPSTTHVYPSNPKGGTSQRGVVRVESATGYFDRAFEVPIENAAPRVEPIPAQRATASQEMTYQVQASDPGGEGDTLTYSLEGAPDWVRVSGTGLLSWLPPREWAVAKDPRLRFELVVSDDEGAQTRVPVELVAAVHDPGQLPVAPAREDPGGCSTTGGALPVGLALLGFLLGPHRRRATSR